MNFAHQSGQPYDTRKARRSALLLFAAAALVLMGIIVASHLVDRHLSLATWSDMEQRQIDTTAEDFHHQYDYSLSELLILASHREWFNPTPAAREALRNAFIHTAQALPQFNQLRLIDQSGQERVRVNAEKGVATAVPDEQLQNKATRYYFVEGMKLKPGEIYVSPLDLNVEHGQIEIPHRPMIRLVVPAMDEAGYQRGVLVANINADTLLSNVAGHDSLSASKLMLLNSDGYWLYSSAPGEAWGFQLPHGRSFVASEPEAWQRISATGNGQFSSARGIFTYRTLRNELLSPPGNAHAQWKVVNAPHWHLVSQADRHVIYARSNTRLEILIGAVCVALLLLIPFSRAWGIRGARSAYASERLHAYAAIIEQSDELIYVVSSKGTILFANPAVERCYGYNQAELVGQPASIFKSGRHPADFYKLLWATICSGQVFEGVLVNKRKDGRLFYEAKRITPVHLEDRNETVFVSTGRDLTAEIEKNRQSMDAANRISGGIQHHFNNLLNVITGGLSIATKKASHGNLDASALKMLNLSLESAVRAQELVSRIAHGRNGMDPHLDPLDMKEVAQSCIDTARAQMPEGLSLALSMTEKLPPILGDQAMLTLALQALIENAQDAMSGRGQVRVSLSTLRPVHETCLNCGEPILGEHLVIAVSDTGTGIDTQHLKEIFEPFYSTKESAKLVAKTPGIGLTIVRSIVHMHGGHILVDTRPGQGTTVRMLLPVHAQ